MTSRNNTTVIQEWFDKTGGGGMILPDRWFGRPYDNIHQLTNVQSLENALRIELDGQLTLDFQGSVVVEVVDSTLRIKGFDALLFNWREYGSNIPHSQSYSGGVVEFIP